PNGEIIDKEKAMREAGYTKNENGEWVDANGNVVDPKNITVGPNGEIIDKEKAMREAGYTKNENGEWVDANGNVVDPGNLTVGPNGEIVNIEQAMLNAGYTKNANGEWVDANGNVVDPGNLTVGPNGEIVDAAGNVIATTTDSELEILQSIEDFLGGGAPIKLIIGGSSSDGKAKTVELPVEEVENISTENINSVIEQEAEDVEP
ncbi:MAG: hypothetical protein MI865_11885, partial [Proteobacteria bacterium]|nr:hypothetical protein [Pseudomonadota bacterium]